MNDKREIFNLIFGSPDKYKLSNIATRTLIVTSFLISGLMLITFSILDSGIQYTLASGTATILYAFFYFLSRKHDREKVLILPLIILENLLILYIWYNFGGITGPSLIIAISFMIVLQIILKGMMRFFSLSLQFLVITVLFIIELMNPDVVHLYENRIIFMTDIYVTSIVMCFGMLIFVSIFLRSYNYKNSQVEILNKTLKNANDILEEKNNELEIALEEIKTLQGILPICSKCKKIRDDKGYWNQIESYISHHTEAQFSHGMCPHCTEEMYGQEEWYKKMKEDEKNE